MLFIETHYSLSFTLSSVSSKATKFMELPSAAVQHTPGQMK